MSGLFGAKSPSASMNLFKALTEKGPGVTNPGQGTAVPLPAGPASPVNTPMTPGKTVKMRRRKLGVPQEAQYRTPYG